ncbi:MAG TPA: SRPBCC family protein [Acidimicrobiales bacterium]|nr:SRPBCC family protein [Acidimicrobiales bacterium]
MSEVSTSRVIDVPPDRLWAMVSDVTRMGEWSPETVKAVWDSRTEGPEIGATFTGTNRHGPKTWKTKAQVIEAEPARKFGFLVKVGGMPVAEWMYIFEPVPGGCRVTESWSDRRNPVLKAVSRFVTGVHDREPHNRAGMEETLLRLSQVARLGDATG